MGGPSPDGDQPRSSPRRYRCRGRRWRGGDRRGSWSSQSPPPKPRGTPRPCRGRFARRRPERAILPSGAPRAIALDDAVVMVERARLVDGREDGGAMRRTANQRGGGRSGARRTRPRRGRPPSRDSQRRFTSGRRSSSLRLRTPEDPERSSPCLPSPSGIAQRDAKRDDAECDPGREGPRRPPGRPGAGRPAHRGRAHAGAGARGQGRSPR